MKYHIILSIVVVILSLCTITQAGNLVVWGDNERGQLNAPEGDDFIAAAAGHSHSIALREDGSLVAWGWNQWGQCNVPSGNDFVAVAAGATHSLALRADGSIVAWGGNSDDGYNISPEGTYTAITAGDRHNLATADDGRLIAWGYNYWGQCGPWANDYAVRTPTRDGPTNVVDYVGGLYTTVMVLDDGSLDNWGGRAGIDGWDERQLNELPGGNDFVGVAGGDEFSAAFRDDGSVATWGVGAFSVNWSDTSAIGAGSNHLLGLDSSGHILAAGDNTYGQCNVPSGDGYDAVYGGQKHSLALYLPPPVIGDFDGDKDVDAADIDILSAAIRAGSTDPQFDMDGDGDVDSEDFTLFVHEFVHTSLTYFDEANDTWTMTGTAFGDFNLDGVVDLLDLGSFGDGYNALGSWATGDANGDGIVILNDLGLLGDSYFATPPAEVPEPGTMSLLALGGLALLRKRGK